MSIKKVSKKELSEKANALNVKGVARLRKRELIHAIQIAEGNTDCYTRISSCAISPCLYRAECQH